MMKKIIYLLFLLKVAGMHSTTITSVQCGAWSASSTWDLNRVPLPTDTIVVNSFVAFDTDFTSNSPGMLHVTACGTLCGSHTYTGQFLFDGVVYMYTLICNYGHSISNSIVNIQQMIQVSGTGSYTVYGSTCVGCTSHCQNCSTNNRADSVGCLQNGIMEILARRVEIFPNPVSEKLFIKGNSELGEVDLYSTWGSKILRVVGRQNDLTLEMRDMVPGIYFVCVAGRFYKIVKQ